MQNYTTFDLKISEVYISIAEEIFTQVSNCLHGIV